MKATFIVTIEGDWLDGDKRVTAAQAGKDLRQAVKQQFQYMAKRTSVKPLKAASPAPVGAGVVPDWQECERISYLPAVYDALYAFTHDPTADNGTCVVRAVLESAATAHPVAADDQVLEKAASLCVTIGKDWDEAGDSAKRYAAEYLAESIRALKSRTTAHGGAQGEQA